MYKIYSLNDPITNEIRYIGYTSRELDIRLNEHIRNSKYTNTYKNNWIKSLNENPIINLLKDNIKDLDETLEMEKFYIKKYKNLTNGTKGGEKNKEFTDDIKNKISNTLKLKYKNGDIKLWNKGRKLTDEEYDKCFKNRKNPYMFGEKNPFYGKKHSDETKKLISEKNRKHKQFTYNELYELYIIQNMSQKDISLKIKLTRPYVCKMMKKYDLVKIKKEIYGKIK